MKKSELTQLTQLIEILVAKEIRKQLPQLIGEVFANMAGKSMVTENVKPTQPKVEEPEHIEMKESLRELFAGATPVTRSELEEGVVPKQRPTIRYTKDPVLNEILNSTTPDLRKREGMVGMASLMQPGYGGAPSMPSLGAGPMMSEAELPSFARGNKELPSMPTPSPSTTVPAVSIREDHVPLSDIPDGISALDVARAGMTPAPVTEALTNYDRMKKILDASKSKRY